MEVRRRTLMSAALAGAGAMPRGPETANTDPAPFEPPRGMTLLTLRRAGSFALGISTPRGVLEVRQDWTTGDMIFDCRKLISFASRMMTIKPGDLLFTGTPQGVISGRPPAERVWLKPGDTLTSSIEGLGELRFSPA